MHEKYIGVSLKWIQYELEKGLSNTKSRYYNLFIKCQPFLRKFKAKIIIWTNSASVDISPVAAYVAELLDVTRAQDR